MPATWPGPRTDVTGFLTGYVFTEGPRWHEGRLWFSDMHGESIYAADLSGEVETILRRPGLKPSGLGFTPAGDLLFVEMHHRYIGRLSAGVESIHADLSHLLDVELNDMVVDAEGRAYVGSYPVPGEGGPLIFVDADGTASIAADDLLSTNGTVITPGGSVLIVTESMGRCLTAFDIAADGSLSNRRVHAPTPGFAGDGLAMDADGSLWSAQPLAQRFIRVAPGGEVLEEISTGDHMAIACAFGGPGLSTLFLLTAPHYSAAVLEGRRESVISTTRPGTPGAAGAKP